MSSFKTIEITIHPLPHKIRKKPHYRTKISSDVLIIGPMTIEQIKKEFDTIIELLEKNKTSFQKGRMFRE